MLYVETITNFIDNYQLLFWTHSWANIITLIILAYFQLIGLVMAEKIVNQLWQKPFSDEIEYWLPSSQQQHPIHYWK